MPLPTNAPGGVARTRFDPSKPQESLWLAARHGNAELARQALDLGADPNAAEPGDEGARPLHGAARYDSDECVRLLLSRGAVPTTPNEAGETPLHMAAIDLMSSTGFMSMLGFGQDAIDPARLPIHALIETGVELDPIDSYGNSPLHGAAMTGYAPAAQALLAAGADPDLLSKDGRSCSQSALDAGHLDLAALIQSFSERRQLSASTPPNGSTKSGPRV